MCYPASFWYVTPPPPAPSQTGNRHRGISVEKIDEVGAKSRSYAKYTQSSPRKRLHSPPTMRYNDIIRHRQRRDILWQTYRCNINIAKNKRVYPFVVGLPPNDNG